MKPDAFVVQFYIDSSRCMLSQEVDRCVDGRFYWKIDRKWVDVLSYILEYDGFLHI